jgi:hypothetical protein
VNLCYRQTRRLDAKSQPSSRFYRWSRAPNHRREFQFERINQEARAELNAGPSCPISGISDARYYTYETSGCRHGVIEGVAAVQVHTVGWGGLIDTISRLRSVDSFLVVVRKVDGFANLDKLPHYCYIFLPLKML